MIAAMLTATLAAAACSTDTTVTTLRVDHGEFVVVHHCLAGRGDLPVVRTAAGPRAGRRPATRPGLLS
jgi:hypothetical protein